MASAAPALSIARAALIALAALAGGGLLAPAGAEAGQLYDNTSNELPIRYNPFDPTIIVFDDIPIPRSQLQVAGRSADFVALDRVVVGVRRLASSPAVNVSLFAAAFASDFLGSNLNLNLDSIQFLGSQSLPTSIATAITTPVILSLAADPVEIPLVYDADYGYLALGLALSNPASGNGWRLMESSTRAPGIGCYDGTGVGPSNIGCFWEVDALSGDQFLYAGFTTSLGNVAASFYAQVDGRPTLAPTPSPLPLFGAFAAFSASRRLRGRLRGRLCTRVGGRLHAAELKG